ncbi:hypothetical protein [Nesterenkonia suensis]
MSLGASALLLTAVGLVGCGADDAEPNGEDGDAQEAVEHPEVQTDLEEARQTILDGLEEFGEDQSEFLLADDVSSAEQKYGMWVLPFEHSEATESMTSQVNIDGGDFTIEAEAAEDGTTYVIDQDGEISTD